MKAEMQNYHLRCLKVDIAQILLMAKDIFLHLRRRQIPDKGAQENSR